MVGPLPSFLAIAGESVSSCTLAFHQLAMALKTPKLLAAFVTESFFAKAITFSFWDVVYDILIAVNYPLCIWLSCSDHHPANMIGQFHYPTLCLLGEISRNHFATFGRRSSFVSLSGSVNDLVMQGLFHARGINKSTTCAHCIPRSSLAKLNPIKSCDHCDRKISEQKISAQKFLSIQA